MFLPECHRASSPLVLGTSEQKRTLVTWLGGTSAPRLPVSGRPLPSDNGVLTKAKARFLNSEFSIDEQLRGEALHGGEAVLFYAMDCLSAKGSWSLREEQCLPPSLVEDKPAPEAKGQVLTSLLSPSNIPRPPFLRATCLLHLLFLFCFVSFARFLRSSAHQDRELLKNQR